MSMLLAGFNGVAYFLSSLIPIWIIDRLGRRKLMLFAAAGQGFCMAILAGTVSDGSTSAGIVASIMLFAFNFFFAVGLLAIPWLRKSSLRSLIYVSSRLLLFLKSDLTQFPLNMPHLRSAKELLHLLQRVTGYSPSSWLRSRLLVSATSGIAHTFISAVCNSSPGQARPAFVI